MALKAGRVGVSPDQVDPYGKITGGGGYTLPTASANTLGGVKIGDRLTINDGVLSANDQSYTLPTASANTLGGVKVGSGLSINDGVLSASSSGLSIKQSGSFPSADTVIAAGAVVTMSFNVAQSGAMKSANLPVVVSGTKYTSTSQRKEVIVSPSQVAYFPSGGDSVTYYYNCYNPTSADITVPAQYFKYYILGV